MHSRGVPDLNFASADLRIIRIFTDLKSADLWIFTDLESPNPRIRVIRNPPKSGGFRRIFSLFYKIKKYIYFKKSDVNKKTFF